MQTRHTESHGELELAKLKQICPRKLALSWEAAASAGDETKGILSAIKLVETVEAKLTLRTVKSFCSHTETSGSNLL